MSKSSTGNSINQINVGQLGSLDALNLGIQPSYNAKQPSLFFLDDPRTGVSRVNKGSMSLVHKGISRITIDGDGSYIPKSRFDKLYLNETNGSKQVSIEYKDSNIIFGDQIGTFNNIVPYEDSTHSLGSLTNKWEYLYVDNIVSTGPINFEQIIIDTTNTEALLVRKNNDGGDVFVVDTSSDRIGVGTSSPSTTVHAISTNEQLRLGYNDSNYASFTVDDEGELTVAPTGAETHLTGKFHVSDRFTMGNTSTITSDMIIYSGPSGVGVIYFDDDDTDPNDPDSHRGSIWYIHSSDSMYFGTAGAIRMTFDSNGDLGIGTTSPSARVHSLSTTEQLRLGYDGSNYASFTVDNAGELTVAPTGGDTYLTGKFHVSDRFTMGDTSTTTSDMIIYSSTAGFGIIYFDDDDTDPNDPDNHQGSIRYLHSNDTMYFGTAGIIQMTLNSNGDLGVGTSSPSTKVHSLSTTEQLRLGYDGSNYASFTVDDAGDLTIAPSGGNLSVTGNIAVTGTVDGVDIAAFKTSFDAVETEIALFDDELQSLTAAEIQQLQNIDITTISTTQWGYVGSQDQPLATTDSVTFDGQNLTGVLNIGYNSGTNQIELERSDATAAFAMYFDSSDYMNFLNNTSGKGFVFTSNTAVSDGSGLVASDLVTGNYFVTNPVNTKVLSGDFTVVDGNGYFEEGVTLGTTSQSGVGFHSQGSDIFIGANNGTFYFRPISSSSNEGYTRIGDSFISCRNEANTDDLNIVTRDASDTLTYYDTLSIDSSSNVSITNGIFTRSITWSYINEQESNNTTKYSIDVTKPTHWQTYQIEVSITGNSGNGSGYSSARWVGELTILTVSGSPTTSTYKVYERNGIAEIAVYGETTSTSSINIIVEVLGREAFTQTARNQIKIDIVHDSESTINSITPSDVGSRTISTSNQTPSTTITTNLSGNLSVAKSDSSGIIVGSTSGSNPSLAAYLDLVEFGDSSTAADNKRLGDASVWGFGWELNGNNNTLSFNYGAEAVTGTLWSIVRGTRAITYNMDINITNGYDFSVNNDTFYVDASGDMVGIGTASPSSLLHLYGTVTDVMGPHIQATTTDDIYPVFQQLNWGHDDISLNFDCYYDGSWKSSDAGSNFQIRKKSDQLQFNYSSTIAAGSGVSLTEAMRIDISGNVTIPNGDLGVTGRIYATATSTPHLLANSTTDPVALLLQGNATQPNTRIDFYTPTGRVGYLQGSDTTTLAINGGSTLLLQTSDTSALTIDTNQDVIIPNGDLSVIGDITCESHGRFQYVGINTTASGNTYLEVRPDTETNPPLLRVDASSNNSIVTIGSNSSSGNDLRFHSSDTAYCSINWRNAADDDDDALIGYNRNTQIMNFTTEGTTAMNIDGNQDITIPNGNLEVNGNITLDTLNPTINFDCDDTIVYRLQAVESGNYIQLGHSSNMGLRCYNSGDVRFPTANVYVDSGNFEVNGVPTFISNGANARIVGTDHVYLEFYPQELASDRKGYIGYGGALSQTLIINNEFKGADSNMTLTTEDIITLNGSSTYVNKHLRILPSVDDTAHLSVHNSSDQRIFEAGTWGTGSGFARLFNAAGTQQILLNTLGDSYLLGGNIGIGTSSPSSLLHLYGTVASLTGPHMQATTTADIYPLFQQLSWSHDNIALNFDCYYDGSWKSSDAGSNFQIRKISDQLQFNYSSTIAAGSGVSLTAAMSILNNGDVNFGSNSALYVDNDVSRIGLGTSSPDAVLHIHKELSSGTEEALLILDAHSTGANNGPVINFESNPGGNRGIYAQIAGLDDSNYGGRLEFRTRLNTGSAGTDNVSTHMTIKNNGYVGFGASPSYPIQFSGSYTSNIHTYTASTITASAADADMYNELKQPIVILDSGSNNTITGISYTLKPTIPSGSNVQDITSMRIQPVTKTGTGTIAKAYGMFIYDPGVVTTTCGMALYTDNVSVGYTVTPPTNGALISGDVGIGVDSPAAKCHIIDTTEQVRIGYDTDEYVSVTVDNIGDVEITPTGDEITINSDITVEGVRFSPSGDILSHYESGTFTAILGQGSPVVLFTISSQTCNYIRVGSIVYITMDIVWSATGGSTAARISGFPGLGSQTTESYIPIIAGQTDCNNVGIRIQASVGYGVFVADTTRNTGNNISTWSSSGFIQTSGFYNLN